MISKRFIQNSVIYTIAGALPMASAIILLPFYIEYLSTEVFGVMALYTSFSMLVQIFVTYSFDASVYNYFHDYKNDKAKLHAFISSVFTFILIISLITLLFFAASGNWIFGHIFSGKKILFYPYGLISVATGIFQALFKVNSSLQQTQEKAASFLWYNLLSFSLIALFTIIGLFLFPNDLIGPIGGRFLAVAISGLWVLASNYRLYGFRFDFQLIKSTFGFSQPALIYQLMQWVNNYYDRMLMTFYLPMTQVGIYDFAVKCLTAIELALTGFNSSFFPKVLGIVALQTEKKTTPEINRYYNGLTAVTILLVGLCIFCFPLLITWLVSKPGYLEVIPLIPFLAVTYLLRSMRFYVAMPYGALKYAKPLPLFYLVIVATKIVAMIILIPRYGIMGVIIATWVGYAVEVVILYFGIRNKFAIHFNIFKLAVAPLVMALLIVVLEPTVGILYPVVIHGFYIALGLALLGWTYRNELKVFSFSKLIK